ncbi:MAG: ABC transporter substrate-binding protein [Tepidiformaceae bacterium]
MNWKQGIGVLASAGLLLGAAAACDDDGGDVGLRDVTLMLDFTPNTNHSGIYLAIENGWYEEEGLRVTIVEPAAAGVEPIVGQGDAEFGISYQEYLVPARVAEVPIVSIAAILQHNDSSFMSLGDDGIEDASDLEGKRYGGFGGPLEIALIEKLVECEGGDPGSVEFTEMGTGDALVAMEDDRFDFVWEFEAWGVIRARELLEKEVNTVRFRDYFDCIPDWYTPIIITSEAMIAEDPEVVEAFMAATARGYEEAIDDPQAGAAALSAAVPELDEELVELSAEYIAGVYVDDGRQWGQQDEEIWIGFVEFLVDAGLIEEAIDVEDAYTNAFLPD